MEVAAVAMSQKHSEIVAVGYQNVEGAKAGAVACFTLKRPSLTDMFIETSCGKTLCQNQKVHPYIKT